MSKAFLIIIILVLIALAIGGYWYWKQRAMPLEIADGVFLPEVSPTGNPVNALLDTNPVSNANPFGSTYKNPFE